MRVVHFTLGRVNPDSSNGINRVIEGLSKYGNQLENVEIDVVCYKPNQKNQRQLYQRDGFNVLAFKSFFHVMTYFQKNSEKIDVVHLHNSWSFHNVILSVLLTKKSIPYIVTIHAGLMADRVKGSNYLLKILFHFFLQKRHFDRAYALQAIAREEMTNISDYTSNQNIFLIPNGIDTELIDLPKEKIHNDKINIGYLGRLSEEKNILGLISAISKLDIVTLNRIRLVIMGPVTNRYAKKCISLVESLGLHNHIVFLGKINSKDKWIALSNLDIFIQVSYSEGASLSILEAMYSKLPLIISRTCNISYLNGHDFLKMVEPIPSDISRGILEAVTDIESFRRAGLASHDYVKNNFEWQLLVCSMIQVYGKSISNKNE